MSCRNFSRASKRNHCCPGSASLRVHGKLLHPFAQHVLVNIQIARRLRNCDTALSHQPHRINLELADELPSLHRRPPIGENIVSQCPPNRQQASFGASSELGRQPCDHQGPSEKPGGGAGNKQIQTQSSNRSHAASRLAGIYRGWGRTIHWLGHSARWPAKLHLHPARGRRGRPRGIRGLIKLLGKEAGGKSGGLPPVFVATHKQACQI